MEGTAPIFEESPSSSSCLCHILGEELGLGFSVGVALRMENVALLFDGLSATLSVGVRLCMQPTNI